MKDFIDCLKKHGYELRMSVRLGREGQQVHRDGNLLVEFYDTSGSGNIEQPDLAFWCLEEIERLVPDYLFSLSKRTRGDDDGTTERVWTVGGAGSVWLHATPGKTKTEACCNALKAVLDAVEEGVGQEERCARR